VQTKIEPSLLELYWVQPKFKEFKCLASECKAKLAWTLPSAARHSKNLNVLQTKIEPSLLELYWVQPKFKEFKCRANESRVIKFTWMLCRVQPTFKEFKCLASECKAKLAWTLLNAARHSKNLNFVQTKIEPSLLELYWVQPKFKEFKCLASESRVKLAWTMPSAAEILQRKSYLRRKLRYNNRKRHTLNELNYLLGF
jgi:hypothetical protein